MTASPDEILRRLRLACLALPEVSEVRSFGHLAFRVGKKLFVVLERYHGRLCIVFKAEPMHQQALAESSPNFLVAPYIGKDGWVSMAAEGDLDWDEVRLLFEDSHRLVNAAPERKVSQVSRPVHRSTRR